MCPDKVASTPPLQRCRHIAYRYVTGRLVSMHIVRFDPPTRWPGIPAGLCTLMGGTPPALVSRPPPAKVTGTGGQRKAN